MEENKRVLLGMSGGTDSSVAAMRLLEAGYEVTGVTFRFYELNDSTEYLEDARHLAGRLGIRHITYVNIWWGILLCPARCAITISNGLFFPK